MYLYDQRRLNAPPPSIGELYPASRFAGYFAKAPKPAKDQIQFIAAEITQLKKDGRVQLSFRETGAMSTAQREKFIKRFIDPMLRYDLGRNLLVAINQGSYPVGIAWGNGKFGVTGTIAIDRERAVGGKGSGAVIFIDEEAQGWKSLETIVGNPDVGLFHELLHARRIQLGTVVENEREMERQIIGIGKHSNNKGTENHYRDVRGLQLRCCWDREKL